MAQVVGQGGVKVKVRTDPDMFWNYIQHSTKYFPKAAPTLYSSIKLDPKNGNLRYITCGPRAENIKKSTENITKNSRGEFAYTVTGGDILERYPVRNFSAVIRYPKDQWVAWTWTYNYYPHQEEDAVGLDKELAEIAAETLAKLDYYIQSESFAGAKLQADLKA